MERTEPVGTCIVIKCIILCYSSQQHSSLIASLKIGLRNAGINQPDVFERKIFKQVEHAGQCLKAFVLAASFDAVVLFAFM